MQRPHPAPSRLFTTAAATAVLSACLTAPATAQIIDNAQPARVDEVVVTGSRIAGGDRLAAVDTVNLNTLEAAGAADMSHVLRLVTANSGSEAQIDQLNNPQSSGTAQFNLRNLGLGSTLVLVDGQRWTNSAVVATDGSAFVDINSLMPSIALQRIEVLKDGASAIYGSDAVAGVVNFITRTGVARPELRAKYAFAHGSDETVIEGIGSFDIGPGNLTLAASRFHRSALGSDERDFTQAANYGRAAWSAVSSYGQPGSYFRPSSQTFAPDPDCENPAFPGSYRNGPADTFCRLDYSNFFDLVPEETRTQLMADYRQQVGTVDVWAQGLWSSTYTRARQSPSLPILSRTLTVPANHPDNPFGEEVAFRGRLLGGAAGASAAEFDYETWRLAGGASGDINTRWRWDINTSFSRQTVAYDKPDVLGNALQNALNGFGGAGCDRMTGIAGVGACQFYNPFGSAYLGTGTANSQALQDSLAGWTRLRGRSELFTLDGSVQGRAAEWTGGHLDLAGGLQYRRSTFRHDWSDAVNAGDLLTAGYAPDFSGDQETFAAYGEARLSLAERVEIQLAGRHESYDGQSGKFSPKLAARWDATEALSLRGSWGKGYRAPSVFTTQGALASQPSVLDRGSFVFVNTLTSGDRKLAPETSEHLSFGALWSPVSGLDFAVDGWSINYSDLVIKEAPQPIIDRAAADDAAGLSGTDAQRRVTRSASGAISMVQLYFINASSIKTSGVDFSARYQRPLFEGQLSASAKWTVVDRYDIRMNAQSGTVSGVGSTNLNTLGRSLPKNRGEFALSWSDDRHAVTGLVHYTSGYSNDRAGITDTSIASQTTADLLYRYTVNQNLELSVGAVNIFDKAPPLAQFFLAYDPVVADPRGRVISLGLTQRF